MRMRLLILVLMKLMIHLAATEGADGEDFIIGGTQVLTLVGTASSATAVTGIVTWWYSILLT